MINGNLCFQTEAMGPCDLLTGTYINTQRAEKRGEAERVPWESWRATMQALHADTLVSDQYHLGNFQTIK